MKKNVSSILSSNESITSESPAKNNSRLRKDDVNVSSATGNNDTPTEISTNQTHASTRTNKTTPSSYQVAWCILDANNTLMFHHFPHASQSLFPCWSYFERMRETNPNIECGFWFRNWTPPADISAQYWQSQLMKAMRCKETKRPPSSPPNQQTNQQHVYHRIELVGGFAKQIENYTTVPDIHWFDRPRDAWRLRDAVLKYYNVTVAPRPRPILSNQLRIGLVQRRPTAKRVILNLPDIAAELQKAFPNAWITNTTSLEGKNLGEQARYFASHDIIIAAHGAALTNCVFLQPGSLVIQLYPNHYYPIFFFEPLIRQVNSHAFSWYAGYPKDPLQDHLKNLPHRFQNRPVDIKPPVDEIVAMVVNATRNMRLIQE